MKRRLFGLWGGLIISSLMFGQESLPFRESFDSTEGFERFTVVDNNKDNTTWTYDASNQLAIYNFHATNDGDDWLFTPALAFKKGKQYKISFKTQAKYASARESMALTFGQSTNPGDHKNIEAIVVAWTDMRESEFDFSVEADGLYYIGFHETSEKDSYFLKLDDIYIREFTEEVVPDTVSQVRIKVAEKGELKAEISFQTPSFNAEGNDLQSSLSIDIYRNDVGAPIKTYDDQEKGVILAFMDTLPASGEYIYKIVARNKGGEGNTIERKVYVGFDVPLKVANIRMVEYEDSCLLISWDVPPGGVHGGYVDTENLMYFIEDNSQRPVASDLRDLSFLDSKIDYSQTRQQMVYYKIHAVNHGIEGVLSISPLATVGKAYKAPLEESFSMAMLSYYPWYSENTGTDKEKYWEIRTYGSSPAVEGQDLDAGLLTFRSYVAPNGYTEYFYSPKIDISSLIHPVLSFYMYHTNRESDTDQLVIYIATDVSDFVRGVESYTLYNSAGEGWVCHQIPLDEHIGSDSLFIALKGISANGHNIHVDRIAVYDDCCDVSVSTLSYPRRFHCNRPFKIECVVANKGMKDSGTSTILLYRNGEEADRKEVTSLSMGDSCVCDFIISENILSAGKEVRWSFEIINNLDEKAANNKSEDIVLVGETPRLPVITNLSAEQDGTKIRLAWNKPDHYLNYPITTDSFETYIPFSIDEVGSWKFMDGDGALTGSFKHTEIYDHYEEPMAYQVFNPIEAGIDMEIYGEMWKAYQGNQYLISVYNQDSQIENNDWLISPQVANDKEVSFYAKTLSDGYNLEMIEFLYSSKSNASEDFEVIENVIVPDEWTSYSFSLPADAKYFALRNKTKGGSCLMVDNLSCALCSSEPLKEEAISYKVYRNGMLCADKVTETSFVDIINEKGIYNYKVTSLFSTGESYYADVEVSVIDFVGMRDNNVQSIMVGGQKGFIKILLEANGKCIIMDVTGKVVYSSKLTGENLIEMPRGIYIVKIDDYITKVIVK